MVVGLLAVLLLSGCGGGPVTGQKHTTEPTTAAATPVGERPADEEPEPAPAPAAACDLSGSHPAYVTLQDENDTLDVFVDWSGQSVAPTGTTGFYVNVYDADGNGGQLGVKYLDGKQISYFIADLGGGQVNLNGRADWDTGSMSAAFPKDRGFLAGREIVKWSAAYALAGSDVGNCPDSAGGTLPFPG